ncbi:hypothetical protein BH23CHL2_BH23CHL2_32110 [soil metagenome]
MVSQPANRLPLADLVTGFASGPMNPFLDTVHQLRVPPRCGVAGIQTTLIVKAIAMLLVIGWMALSPTLRQVDQ